MKLDKRKNYYLTLDTETFGDLMAPMVYDLGGIVHDKKGNVLEKFSFVIRETFLDLRNMQTVYYYDKMPQYIEDLADQKRELVSIIYAYHYVRDLIEKYNIKAIVAYNMRFDYRALNNTLRNLTTDFMYFFPKEVEIYDSMKMAQDTICKQKSYKYFCEKYGFVTNHKKPRLQTKAETVYRYMTFNPNFVEEHKGLQDCEIEVEIFARCMRQHKKMRKLLFEN